MMRKLLASVAPIVVAAAVVSVAAHVNTNANSRMFISSTSVTPPLARADFEALTWIEIAAIGNLGEAGTKTNMVNYDTWNTSVIQKGKGLSDAGSPELDVARVPTDPGQIAVRAAALTNLNYAIKIIRNDPAVIGGTGTIIYNAGLVVGPARPFGKNEDFDIEKFTFGFNQREVVVDPGAGGNPPVNTVAPAITGTAQVAQVLTCSTGTFTGDATITYAYQWFAGGVAISGANASTFTVTSAQVGKVISCRVLATNSSGSAIGFSAPTSAVIP